VSTNDKLRPDDAAQWCNLFVGSFSMLKPT
jgi:hypothetical protein